MVLLARGLLGQQVERTLVDVDDFRFAAITDPADPMFLPGAVRYGDLGGLAATAFPASLTLFVKSADQPALRPLSEVYQAGGESLPLVEQRLTTDMVLKHLPQSGTSGR